MRILEKYPDWFLFVFSVLMLSTTFHVSVQNENLKAQNAELRATNMELRYEKEKVRDYLSWELDYCFYKAVHGWEAESEREKYEKLRKRPDEPVTPGAKTKHDALSHYDVLKKPAK